MITRNQWLQIVGIIIAACTASSSLWTQLFGTNTASIVVSMLGLSSTILAGVSYVLTGQGQQIKDVAAMPGVQSITLNSAASQAAAQVAVDPNQPKVGGSSASVQSTLQQTAKGT